jgi:hypothetical protein
MLRSSVETWTTKFHRKACCWHLAVKLWTISKFLPCCNLAENCLLCCHLSGKIWSISKFRRNYLPCCHLLEKFETISKFTREIFSRAAIYRKKFELVQNFRHKFFNLLPSIEKNLNYFKVSEKFYGAAIYRKKLELFQNLRDKFFSRAAIYRKKFELF